jgi:hypothetical protein
LPRADMRGGNVGNPASFEDGIALTNCPYLEGICKGNC